MKRIIAVFIFIVYLNCKSTTLYGQEKRNCFIERSSSSSPSAVRLCRRRSFLLNPRRRRPRINGGVHIRRSQLTRLLQDDCESPTRIDCSNIFLKINQPTNQQFFSFWSKKVSYTSAVFLYLHTAGWKDSTVPNDSVRFQMILFVLSIPIYLVSRVIHAFAHRSDSSILVSCFRDGTYTKCGCVTRC